MIPLLLTVYGVPVAQGRPKFFRRGNHVGAYDPAKSRNWKSDVRMQMVAELHKRGSNLSLFEGAVKMEIHAYMPRPKSLPKRVVHHIKKPDGDNIAKGVKDAAKGVLYRDDSQVIELLVRKSYGDPPRVVIGVRAAEESHA